MKKSVDDGALDFFFSTKRDEGIKQVIAITLERRKWDFKLSRYFPNEISPLNIVSRCI